MNSIDEQNIINRCQQGDKNAFRLVVEHYQRMVFSAAIKMLCNEDSAMDIVQETFIRVWLNIRKYDEDHNFRTWIYTIAVRLCFDAMEKSKRVELMPEDEACLKDFVNDQTPGNNLENSELASVIKALARNLSPKQRVVFTLICLENMDVGEVEKITGVNALKIKSNLYVARKTIKEQLKRLGYE
jgi:RNA polymerase sigma-70 factor (ECF subfamily)